MIRHPDDMTIGQLLNKALEMEKEARDFYAGLAAACSVDFVRELIEKLKHEESNHVNMIQELLVTRSGQTHLPVVTAPRNKEGL